MVFLPRNTSRIPLIFIHSSMCTTPQEFRSIDLLGTYSPVKCNCSVQFLLQHPRVGYTHLTSLWPRPTAPLQAEKSCFSRCYLYHQSSPSGLGSPCRCRPYILFANTLPFNLDQSDTGNYKYHALSSSSRSSSGYISNPGRLTSLHSLLFSLLRVPKMRNLCGPLVNPYVLKTWHSSRAFSKRLSASTLSLSTSSYSPSVLSVPGQRLSNCLSQPRLRHCTLIDKISVR
jgi:hypothetical protein